MPSPVPLLALDFDGVICNGLSEYFRTTCRAYDEIWGAEHLGDWEADFCGLRPVIESGWEMPILLRALAMGVTKEAITQHWAPIRDEIVKAEECDRIKIATIVDRVRDRWIQEDLAGWLALHRFYPGVLEQIQTWLLAKTPELWIISTKEGRFIAQLLHQQGIDFPGGHIFGKEVKRPKADSLRQLLFRQPGAWFVEDRMETLENIADQPDLQVVELFLADWGYNTANMRDLAQNHPRIRLLSLAQFCGGFGEWGTGNGERGIGNRKFWV
ncbi:MAG: HAD family hydrolase [Spirulina sp. DLM2.Bin59]|nr:MAG: HAD family hydrolase [Spirulina sp. DLM2.Bin59]